MQGETRRKSTQPPNDSLFSHLGASSGLGGGSFSRPFSRHFCSQRSRSRTSTLLRSCESWKAVASRGERVGVREQQSKARVQRRRSSGTRRRRSSGARLRPLAPCSLSLPPQPAVQVHKPYHHLTHSSMPSCTNSGFILAITSSMMCRYTRRMSWIAILARCPTSRGYAVM